METSVDCESVSGLAERRFGMAMLHHRAVVGVPRAVAIIVGVAVLAVTAVGQQQEQPPPASETQEESLTTKDGVLLKATYYPSKEGKDAVPVILLHDHKGSRHELHQYAEFLQMEQPRADGGAFTSLAVIVPDLRGHGGSTQHQLGGRELDAGRLRRGDFAAMVLQDMEAVRRFLREENDDGKLNLNKLVIVGAGMGATVGLNWAAQDWSAPPLATGKQGQDVKAVALVSPQWSFQGVPVAQAMNHPLLSREVDFFITFGKRESSFERDGERIFKIAERAHPPFDQTQGSEKQEVFLFPWDTTQQGGELLLSHPEVGFAIREFIENRVVKQDFPWMERKVD
jgi:pimeloyl-ACP methyl ester carboxylesterase